MTTTSEKLHVIAYQDGEIWLAQVLEHDICVQANSLDELYGRMEVAVRLECENGSLDHIEPAPEHFKRMWERKSGRFTPEAAHSDKYEMALAA